MIQPLRRRHQWMFVGMAIFLTIAFVAGLSVRQPIPATETLPSITTPASEFSHLLFESDSLWANLPITTRVFGDAQPVTRLALELQSRVYLKHPDILVYWSSDSSFSISPQTSGSYLLGTLAGTKTHRFLLPEPALHHDGFLILYSLAQQSKIAVTNLATRTLQTPRQSP